MSKHQHSPHVGNLQNFMNKVAFLDSALRKNTLAPEEILSMLPTEKDSSYLDAGAGSGYLTIPAAQRTDGAVYALDMDERMLQVIDAKAKAENITNIELTQGAIENIPLPDNSVDIALASLILHEVRSLPAALEEISRVLKTDGHFLCLEYEKEESDVQGPPMHIRISLASMEQTLITAGFQVVQKTIPKESIYIIIAKNDR